MNSYQNTLFNLFNFYVQSDIGCVYLKKCFSFFSDSAKQKIADEKAVKRAEQEMEKIEEQMEASVEI